MSLYCPICGSHMDFHIDPGDRSVGYAGGEETFRCSSDHCELGDDWHTDAEVEAAVEAQMRRQGDAA